MTLQQLETFFWTVKLGSFAAAAERLHATQSAVSMRVRELERALCVELFDRTHRAARLTPKGRELMDYASRILDLSTELEHRIGAPEAISGVVRFGVAEVVTTTWLPRLITVIAERYPNVRLEIEEALTAELMASLHQAELELVLAPGHTRTRICPRYRWEQWTFNGWPSLRSGWAIKHTVRMNLLNIPSSE